MKHNIWFSRFLIIFFLAAGNTVNAQGPFNIGTINAGDSIAIYYSVTVNNPLVPSNAPSIGNQGTISGSNFANLLTDDPDTAPFGDATITPLNMFVLPVVFIDLRAYQKSGDIEVGWRVTESNTLKYEVEKSSNGRNFSKIGDVAARGGTANYAFLDINPFAGDNFYRLKVVDRDGAFRFSSIVRVVTGSSQALNIYPNPITERNFNLELRNVRKGEYTLTLYSVSGQKIYATIIQHTGGSASQIINIPPALSKGLYHVQIKGEDVTINKRLLLE